MSSSMYGVKVDINSWLDLLSKNNSFGLKLADGIEINAHAVYVPGKLNLYFVQGQDRMYFTRILKKETLDLISTEQFLTYCSKHTLDILQLVM